MDEQKILEDLEQIIKYSGKRKKVLDLPEKIRWNGYKQQLMELYDFLWLWSYISCDEEEFLSHFTDRFNKPYKPYPKQDYGKLDFKPRYFLAGLITFLIEKEFVTKTFTNQNKYKVIVRHFRDTNIDSIKSAYYLYKRNRTYVRFKDKLDEIFGLNTKIHRDYYKKRNQNSEYKVLTDFGIDIIPLATRRHHYNKR